jgi:hypothetical protein
MTAVTGKPCPTHRPRITAEYRCNDFWKEDAYLAHERGAQERRLRVGVESPARIFGAGDDAVGNAALRLVSADEPYCLSHLVPFDHSIE